MLSANTAESMKYTPDAKSPVDFCATPAFIAYHVPRYHTSVFAVSHGKHGYKVTQRCPAEDGFSVGDLSHVRR